MDDLAQVKPLGQLADLAKMKQQLPVYLQRAQTFSTDPKSVETYSKDVLKWWDENSDSDISAWADAARIAFAIAPNSASCERVFAMVRNMFGDQQLHALKDYIQAALWLQYNKRALG